MKITPNQFAWIFLIVLISAIGGGAYYAYRFFSQPPSEILSVENEMKLSAMIEQQILSSSQQVNLPYADSCVHIMHDRLQAALGGSEYDYKLYVIQADEPNAFAIPGGRIFIHTGLISFCKSPEEVAAVLAHEMGHVEHRHAVDALLKQFGLQALIALLTDGGGGGIDFGQALMQNYFSREDESEADDFALKLLEKSRIRPALLGEVFGRMKAEFGDMEGAMNLLSTHPELEQRSEKSHAYQPAADFVEEPLNIDWARLQQEVQKSQAAGN